MNMLKKITCGLMLSLILVPMPLQAAKAPRENRDHKLQTYQGNKPVVKGNAHGGTGRSATPKRNLNAIYILPKGYKDITIKGKAQATKKTSSPADRGQQSIPAHRVQRGRDCGPVLGGSGTGRDPSGYGPVPGLIGNRILQLRRQRGTLAA